MSIKLHSFGRGDKGKTVVIGDINLFFSYETLVAFKTPEDGLVCCENVWGSTTGGHLNIIEPNHSLRYDPPSFMTRAEKLLERFK